MTSILPASSLTADISDTNQLLDDLLHQLALHTDYSTLKQLKHTYHHITQQRHTHNAAVKQIVTQLTTDVEVIEQQLAAPDLNDARERRRRAETEVKESEARVTGLREVERAVRSEVEEKVDETQRLEQKQHEMQQRHNDSMAELKSARSNTHSRTQQIGTARQWAVADWTMGVCAVVCGV